MGLAVVVIAGLAAALSALGLAACGGDGAGPVSGPADAAADDAALPDGSSPDAAGDGGCGPVIDIDAAPGDLTGQCGACGEPGGPIVVVGYCMGGNLALALALRRQADIAALACLATPWDFHADGQTQAQLIGAIGRSMDPLFQALGEMPVDVLQSLFASLDPLSILAKFRRFADMASDQARKFVALEDWLNDGVGLAAPVARECLTQWYGENTPALGKWLIAGEPVRPEALRLPTLAMVPAADRIVPPRSALGLAQRLAQCETMTPAAGHIGMMVGGSARAKVWDPLDAWLRRIAAS